MKILKLATLFFFLTSIPTAFAEHDAPPLHKDESHLVCYLVENQHIKKDWGKTTDQFIVLHGTWKNQSTSNNYFLVNSHTPEQIEEACRATFQSKGGNVSAFASNSSLTYEYPLVYSNMHFESDMSKVLDEHFILTLAQLSRRTYNPKAEIPSNYKQIDALVYTKGGESLIEGLAFENENSIVIAYKGTDFRDAGKMKKDMHINAGILMQNVYTTESFKKAVDDAMSFYSKIRNSHPHKTIVLTGDSMGGYLATRIAVYTGELARVFSSPATKTSHYGQILPLANVLSMTNVINFVREWDPIVAGSGTHVENMVYFPADKSCSLKNAAQTLMNCHGLGSFIDKVLTPGLAPTHLAIRPDAKLGFGLNHSYYKP